MMDRLKRLLNWFALWAVLTGTALEAAAYQTQDMTEARMA